MGDSSGKVVLSYRMNELDGFMEVENIRKFFDFSSSRIEGVSFVAACYVGVVEGVDMWHRNVGDQDNPRWFVDQYNTVCIQFL